MNNSSGKSSFSPVSEHNNLESIINDSVDNVVTQSQISLGPILDDSDADDSVVSLDSNNKEKKKLRLEGAKLIKAGFEVPDFNLMKAVWPEGTLKPTATELREEIMKRHPSGRPNNYTIKKCIKVLLKLPAVYGTDVSVNKKINFSKQRDLPRLVNVIIHLKEDYLKRDMNLSRLEIDDRGAGRDPFWSKAVELYNSSDDDDYNYNLYPQQSIFDDFLFTNSGYTPNEGQLKAKYNEVRKIIDYALVKFRKSGQGDGICEDGSISSDSNGSTNSVSRSEIKGVSVEDSLNKYSSDFFNFINLDAHIMYFYTAFINYDLLESAVSDMPKNAVGSSEYASSTSYCSETVLCKHNTPPKTIRAPAIIEATKMLCESFAKSKGGEEGELQDSMKRMREAGEMFKKNECDDDEAGALLKNYFEYTKAVAKTHMDKKLKK